VVANPTLFGALALEDGFVDEATIARLSSVANPGAEFEASVPYLELGDRPMPPVFFGARGDANALREGAKFMAKLNARDPNRVAALFRLPREDGAGSGADTARLIAEEADEEAFFFWALMGDGRARLPRFVRRPPSSAPHD
jgi:hypothetical protein